MSSPGPPAHSTEYLDYPSTVTSALGSRRPVQKYLPRNPRGGLATNSERGAAADSSGKIWRVGDVFPGDLVLRRPFYVSRRRVKSRGPASYQRSLDTAMWNSRSDITVNPRPHVAWGRILVTTSEFRPIQVEEQYTLSLACQRQPAAQSPWRRWLGEISATSDLGTLGTIAEVHYLRAAFRSDIRIGRGVDGPLYPLAWKNSRRWSGGGRK